MALRMSPLADSMMMSRASFEGESAVPAGWEEKCLVSSDWRALRRSVGAIGLNLDMYDNKTRVGTTSEMNPDEPYLCHIDTMKKFLWHYSPRIEDLNFIPSPSSTTLCNFLVPVFTP